MTTNHRPTLESKKGKTLGIKDSIVHSRSLSQQTSLKYRTDTQVDPLKGKDALAELKRELLVREGPNKRVKLVETSKDSTGAESGAESASESGSESESELLEELRKLREVEGPNEPVKGAEDADGSVSGSESESDSDTEALLAELQKIRKEKEHTEDIKIKPEPTTEESLSNTTTAHRVTTENPLLPLEGAPTKKSDWRSKKSFSKKEPAKSDTYTNDTLKSDFHQSFLSDFIK